MVYWGDTGFGDTPGSQNQGSTDGGNGGIDMDALTHLMKVLGIGGGIGECIGHIVRMPIEF